MKTSTVVMAMVVLSLSVNLGGCGKSDAEKMHEQAKAEGEQMIKNAKNHHRNVPEPLKPEDFNRGTKGEKAPAPASEGK